MFNAGLHLGDAEIIQAASDTQYRYNSKAAQKLLLLIISLIF